MQGHGRRGGEFLNSPAHRANGPISWLDATLSEGCARADGEDRTSRRNNRRGRPHNPRDAVEIIGLCIGPSEAETFWTEFLRFPARCGGLVGPSDWSSSTAHYKGLKSRHRPRSSKTTWQRCPRPTGCATPWPECLADESVILVRAAAIRQAFDRTRPHPCRRNLAQGRRALASRWPKLDRSSWMADVLGASNF